ncbi:YqaJ viral recombinase family protein [Paramicrobacterium sp. CJ85]|uniref:YqaJ viral recombinase family protein n=1 Tax=Paramicrobacterium sp. CJ85 TaxID=3445355 RepID=UPI003F625123
MSFIIIDDGEDRASWLDARKQGVTATDIATLKHGGAASRAALLAEKLGRKRGFGGNAATAWGREREEKILDHLANLHFGLHASKALVGHIEHPRHMATPDGVGTDCVAEVKTTNKPWKSIDDIPERYLTQMQWQMYVTGMDFCVFGWEEHEDYVPVSWEPEVRIFNRDDDAIDELVDLADGFLREMDAPYQPTRYDDLIAEYNLRRAAVKAAQDELSETDAALREMLAELDSEKVVTPFGNLTWSTPKPRQTFDSTRFKKEHPDTYGEYVKVSQAKPSLRVTEFREIDDE